MSGGWSGGRVVVAMAAAAAVLAACGGGGTALTPSSVAVTSTSTSSTAVATTAAATSAASTTTTGSSAHFVTLPPGAPLPTDEQCAAQVRPEAEIRQVNRPYNETKGHGAPASPPAPLYARVTGAFTGTTDEILQWGACKWGIDEDIVRAQAAKESYWTQTNVGDNGESFGILQVRQPYWGWAFNDGVGDAKSSTAYNVDAALAARRNCFEGNETWLGGSYGPGDIWGCVGLWFSGRWYDDGANTYIAAVKSYLQQTIWLTPSFVNYTG
jgi:autotransporter family porin